MTISFKVIQVRMYKSYTKETKVIVLYKSSIKII
jgi:hypothetical protein